MYRNSEYYPDPTAGAALRQLYRAAVPKGEGFEHRKTV